MLLVSHGKDEKRLSLPGLKPGTVWRLFSGLADFPEGSSLPSLVPAFSCHSRLLLPPLSLLPSPSSLLPLGATPVINLNGPVH